MQPYLQTFDGKKIVIYEFYLTVLSLINEGNRKTGSNSQELRK